MAKTGEPTVAVALDAAAHQALERTWRSPTGVFGWFSAVDHQSIGKRFIVTAFAFFLLGGILALLMSLQLAYPESRFLGPDLYNQIFSMHGNTMMFLFAVPIMQGMGIYLVPLMVGTRNIAFPRLTAFGYYIFLFGGIMLYIAFLLNIGPDAGWFSYVPLAGPEYSPGKRADFWAQMITFTELGSLSIAVALIVTIVHLRAPGMALQRIPLFVWAILVMSWMVIFAMPAVMLASTMLLMDRLIGTQFFNPVEGGDALLWQHLFWFFGHPEVYIIFIPALGIVSSIVATFTRRKLFGYPALVLSLVATAFLGFGLWVHHMFTTDVPQLGQSFFTAASMMIAIPSGVQIFCWIATLWSGRPYIRTPLLFVGFNLTFFPMHQLGLEGMPRRVYTYLAEMGWGTLNLLASLGAALIALSVLVFIGNVLWSRRHGPLAADNPWQAGTLEWATSSPPQPYNFPSLPTVAGSEPLWEHTANQPVVSGLRHDIREVLVTTLLDAEPDHRTRLPGPSIWPLITALAVAGMFIGSIFTPWAVPIGSVPITVALIGWLWPSEREHREQLALEEQA